MNMNEPAHGNRVFSSRDGQLTDLSSFSTLLHGGKMRDDKDVIFVAVVSSYNFIVIH